MFLPSDWLRLEEEGGSNCSEFLEATAAPVMPLSQPALLCLGMLLLIAAGVVMSLCLGLTGPVPLVVVGVCLGLGGVGLMVAWFCKAMKSVQVAVPGHFLLHPRTGTRFSPQQGLAIQR